MCTVFIIIIIIVAWNNCKNILVFTALHSRFQKNLHVVYTQSIIYELQTADALPSITLACNQNVHSTVYLSLLLGDC